jgi:hypothetical protein
VRSKASALNTLKLNQRVIQHYLTEAKGIYGGRQNNGNTKKLCIRMYVGYIDRTSVDNTECSSSVCLQFVVLVSVY